MRVKYIALLNNGDIDWAKFLNDREKKKKGATLSG